VNRFVIEQNADFYNQTEIPLFVDSFASRRGIVGGRQNVAFLHSGPEGFARDCTVSVCQGHTVTFVAMQLAFHMGFKEVALVGCDHSFAINGRPNKVVSASGRDESHFHPDYFSGGVKWELPDLVESEIAYLRAKRVYEAFGRRIVNATRGGRLEIFERCNLDDFVGRP
jgi:hypothetical protein